MVGKTSGYDRTIAAAVAETKNKFALAEALALDIPPRRPGKAEEATVRDYLADARQAIVDAGGEPRSVVTLAEYRFTAMWVMDGTSRTFRWISGVSFSAHNEARNASMSYDDFAAMPKKTVDVLRKKAEKAGTDGPPKKIVDSWTPEQKAEAARELLDDDDVVDQIATRDTVERVARSYHDRQPTPKAQPRDTTRDYDQMVDQGVSLIMVALVAQQSGKWQPNAYSEAYLYFLGQKLLDRQMPEGNFDDALAQIETYANSEAS